MEIVVYEKKGFCGGFDKMGWKVVGMEYVWVKEDRLEGWE